MTDAPKLPPSASKVQALEKLDGIIQVSNDPALRPKAPSRFSDRGQIVMGMLRQYGGRFHGPNVETLSMEEGAFWRFIDHLIEAARNDSKL